MCNLSLGQALRPLGECRSTGLNELRPHETWKSLLYTQRATTSRHPARSLRDQSQDVHGSFSLTLHSLLRIRTKFTKMILVQGTRIEFAQAIAGEVGGQYANQSDNSPEANRHIGPTPSHLTLTNLVRPGCRAFGRRWFPGRSRGRCCI